MANHEVGRTPRTSDADDALAHDPSSLATPDDAPALSSRPENREKQRRPEHDRRDRLSVERQGMPEPTPRDHFLWSFLPETRRAYLASTQREYAQHWNDPDWQADPHRFTRYRDEAFTWRFGDILPHEPLEVSLRHLADHWSTARVVLETDVPIAVVRRQYALNHDPHDVLITDGWLLRGDEIDNGRCFVPDQQATYTMIVRHPTRLAIGEFDVQLLTPLSQLELEESSSVCQEIERGLRPIPWCIGRWQTKQFYA